MSDSSGDTNNGLKDQLYAEGHLAFDSDNFLRALDCYHRASLLDSSDAKVWVALGLTFSNLDFPREAWRSFLLALSLDKVNTNALWHAAEFLFEIEDLALADLFLGRYLALEVDEERLAEAHQLRKEMHFEAAARGITLPKGRGEQVEAMFDAVTNADVRAQIGSLDTEEHQADEMEEEEIQLSDEELEAQALGSTHFLPPLALRLSGFDGRCRHCSLQIPADAPFCWSCRIILFYD
ncbi:MAG: hypothetical protein M3R04_01440 [bacterium]|nr:hypothetical protein [bacterium]